MTSGSKPRSLTTVLSILLAGVALSAIAFAVIGVLAWESLPFSSTRATALQITAIVALVLLVLVVLAALRYVRGVSEELERVERDIDALASGRVIGEDTLRVGEIARLHDRVRATSGRLAEAEAALRADAAAAHQRVSSLELEERRKEGFFGRLAHELRNPLAPIRSAAESLRSTPLDSRQIARAREVIVRQALQLSRLVDDLVDMARIKRGGIELQTILLDLRTVVSVSVHAAVAVAMTRQQVIVWQEPREPVWVDGDPTRLAQIVDNLLSNAMKFSAARGRINVWLHAEDGQALLTVMDYGSGIAPEEIDRVFEVGLPEERLHDDGSAGGLGFGLVLVRELARLHDGTVRVHSEGRGQGATFTVRLPLSTRTPRALEPVPSAEQALPSPARGRVLVVDDNRDSAEALAWILESHHDVQLAYDGREAVDAARAFHPDVVLLDIGLPVLNGYQVAEELRKSPETADAVIIAVTGYGRASDRERALQSGFDFHLVKPAEPTQVLHMVDEAIQHRDASRTTE